MAIILISQPFLKIKTDPQSLQKGFISYKVLDATDVLLIIQSNDISKDQRIMQRDQLISHTDIGLRR